MTLGSINLTIMYIYNKCILQLGNAYKTMDVMLKNYITPFFFKSILGFENMYMHYEMKIYILWLKIETTKFVSEKRCFKLNYFQLLQYVVKYFKRDNLNKMHQIRGNSHFSILYVFSSITIILKLF